MVTTKITVKPHLAEYAIGKWGTDFHEPVEFCPTSEIYYLIHDLTIKRPVNCPVDSGNLTIVLPNRRKDDEMGIRKNPETYNYMNQRAALIIERKIETLMWAELHDIVDNDRHRHARLMIDSIFTFRSKYRITTISEDAMLKNYYRWRNDFRRKEKREYAKKQPKIF